MMSFGSHSRSSTRGGNVRQRWRRAADPDPPAARTLRAGPAWGRERRHCAQPARDLVEARRDEPRPLPLGYRPPAEEIVVRGEQARGLVRGCVGDTAQMLDAGDSRPRSAERCRLAEVRCHRDPSGTRFLDDDADEPHVETRVDLDHACTGGNLLAHRRPCVGDRADDARVLPEAARPVEQCAGRHDVRAIAPVFARERKDVRGGVVQVTDRGHAIPQEQRERPVGDVHVRVDEARDERAAGRVDLASPRRAAAAAPAVIAARCRPSRTTTVARGVTRPSPCTTRALRRTRSTALGPGLVMMHAATRTNTTRNMTEPVILLSSGPRGRAALARTPAER